MTSKELNLLLAMAIAMLKEGKTEDVIKLFEQTINSEKPNLQ